MCVGNIHTYNCPIFSSPSLSIINVVQDLPWSSSRPSWKEKLRDLLDSTWTNTVVVIGSCNFIFKPLFRNGCLARNPLYRILKRLAESQPTRSFQWVIVIIHQKLASPQSSLALPYSIHRPQWNVIASHLGHCGQSVLVMS